MFMKYENYSYSKDSRKVIKLPAMITVYASLCFMLILSLILALAESARIPAARSAVKTRTRLAGNSLLANYNRELFENYHILALSVSSSYKEDVRKEIAKRLMDDIEAGKEDARYDPIKYDQLDMSVEDIEFLTENDGKAFVLQAAEYMKYEDVAELSREILKKLGIIKDNKELLDLIEKKSSVEAAMVSVDGLMRDICEQIDGIHFEYGLPARDNNGGLIINDRFAKKIVVGAVSSKKLGISNSFVYDCIHGKCRDIGAMVNELVSELEILDRDYDKDSDNTRKRYEKCESLMFEIRDLANEEYEQIGVCLELISKLEKDALNLETEINNFNRSLGEEKDSLSEEVYERLKEEGIRLKEQAITNMPKIKAQLKSNMTDMKLISRIESIGLGSNKELVHEAARKIKRYPHKLEGYDVSNISFDYSGLKREKRETENFSMSAVRSLISYGNFYLCMDDISSLSMKRLAVNSLPSGGLKTKKSDIADSVEQTLKSAYSALGKGYKKIRAAISKELDVSDLMEGSFERLTTKILYVQYIQKHFCAYKHKADEIKTDHCLMYEQEYIISGNSTDMANLRAVTARLCGIRFALNYIIILTDPVLIGQAMTLAASSAFWTTPVITYLVQLFIQTLWAYEEAVIDTCALLKGYGVPFIKSAAMMKMNSAGLFTFNKVIIDKLSDTYKAAKDDFFSLSYKDYLMIFELIMDERLSSLRCMDLIQSNLNLKAGENFDISRAVTGIETKVRYALPALYGKTSFEDEIEDKVCY